MPVDRTETDLVRMTGDSLNRSNSRQHRDIVRHRWMACREHTLERWPLHRQWARCEPLINPTNDEGSAMSIWPLPDRPKRPDRASRLSYFVRQRSKSVR